MTCFAGAVNDIRGSYIEGRDRRPEARGRPVFVRYRQEGAVNRSTAVRKTPRRFSRVADASNQQTGPFFEGART